MQEHQTTCQMCGAAGPFERHQLRDRMFEGGGTYEYLRCPDCGSLQIAAPLTPQEMSALYHDTYYSFQASGAGSLRQRLQIWRDQATLQSGPLAARLIGAVIRLKQRDPQLETLARIGLKADMRILDVGCGSGRILDRLARAGFHNLTGIDPFLPKDTITPAGVPLRRASLDEMTAPYEVIMFNHSFEHVPSPGETLVQALRLLSPGGRLVLRVPTVSSEVWDIYGGDWVQLDAPRHTFIPSREGMDALARCHGAIVVATIDDATAFQFIGSELFRRDLSLFPAPGTPSRAATPLEYFTAADLKEWDARTQLLNDTGRGDQAAFVLSKSA